MKTPKTEQPMLFSIPAGPKKRKDKWEEVQEFAELGAQEIGLVTPSVGAQLLEISVSRMSQLLQSDKVSVWEFFGHKYVSVRQLRAFVDLERPTGRPVGWRKYPETVK